MIERSEAYLLLYFDELCQEKCMLDAVIGICSPVVGLWGVGADRANFLEGLILAFARFKCQLALHHLFMGHVMR